MIGWIRRMRQELRGRDECHVGPYGTWLYRVTFSRLRLGAGLYLFEDHWSLHLFGLWVRLGPSSRSPQDVLESWGFGYDRGSAAAHLSWGRRHKILYMPWAVEWVATEHMLADGSFVTVQRCSRKPRWLGGRRLALGPGGKLAPPPDHRNTREYMAWALPQAPGRLELTMPYTYVLRSGEVQRRTATVTAERMTHTYRLPWLFGVFWPARRRTSVWVSLDDEIGEQTGSWKGGAIGFGTDLRPGETVQDAVRRMESTRKFT